jgi:hypothetical protein
LCGSAVAANGSIAAGMSDIIKAIGVYIFKCGTDGIVKLF